MSRFSLIVFDLDGTLVDSRRDLADAANALLVSSGAQPLGIEVVARLVGHGAAMLVSRAFAAARWPEPPDALARFLELYDQRLLNHTRAYAGAERVLEELGARMSLALLTNKPLAATRRVLAGVGLAAHFPAEAIVGGDGPFPRKPDGAGLRHLMARVGASGEDTILVGDSPVDWQTARRAGTRVWLARYGFGFEAAPASRLEPGDRVIDAMVQLLDLLS